MLTLNHVSYSYYKRAEVIHDISASVGPGIHLLLGANEAGKTTLLHLMSGMRFPTSGTCEFNGTPLRERRPEDLCAVQLLDDNTRFPAKTIAEMEKIHSPFFPSFDHDMLISNMERFGLKMDTPLARMSLGTVRKAHLAYMLSLRCNTLLLDEPTNGLDISAKQTLNRMILECVSEEQTVIVSTHTVADLEMLYDSVMVIRQGWLILNMPISEITRRIAFITADTPTHDAVYFEPMFNQSRCIIPNPDGIIESKLDFTLLYNGLMSSSANTILSLLSQKPYIMI